MTDESNNTDSFLIDKLSAQEHLIAEKQLQLEDEIAGSEKLAHQLRKAEAEVAALRVAALNVHRSFDGFYRCVMEFGEDSPRACGEYLDAVAQAEERLYALTAEASPAVVEEKHD